MTRGELRTRTLERLDDPDGVFVTVADANASLDDALEVWAEETGGVFRTAFLPLQPGVAVYRLTAVAPDILAPVRVWDWTMQVRLPAVDLRDLDARHVAWPTVPGPPEVWYPVSWDTLGVWPWPTAGGPMLQLDYVAWPRPLLDDGDAPEWSEGDHDAFVEYAVTEGLCRRWEALRAVEVWSRWQARVADARGTSAQTAQTRPYQRGVTDLGIRPASDAP